MTGDWIVWLFLPTLPLTYPLLVREAIRDLQASRRIEQMAKKERKKIYECQITNIKEWVDQ